VRTTLTIRVEDVDFDTQAAMLRLKGRNIAENAHVKLGAYHTIDVEANRKFTLTKSEWTSVDLDRIELATDPAKSADVAAVIMHEGLAHICLLTASMTVVRAKIDVTVPRKRKGGGPTSQHEKALNKFYDTVLQAVLRHINFDVVKAVIVASPGFVNQQFMDYANQFAVRNDIKLFLENKSKFVLAHASSGFKHALKEVLQEPSVQVQLANTKAAEEVIQPTYLILGFSLLRL
jgi:protein pelota